jgi:Raf kinase inhibitor-like YbhB/YbcL family protein
MRRNALALGTALTLVCSGAVADDFSIASDAFKEGSTLSSTQVFNGFGCEGENISPDLEWQNAPAGTKSFAINLYDPDAPTGSGWWHWIAYNIPVTTTALAAGAGEVDGNGLPEGAVHGRSDYGTYGFGGACPPIGDDPHRYTLTVHALSVEQLDLPEDASAALIGYMVNANTIEKASVTAFYGR